MKTMSLIQKFLLSLMGRPRKTQPLAHRATRLATIPAVLAGFAFATSPVPAEQSTSVVDWKDAATDSAPDTTFNTGNIHWSNCRVVVVGAETDPPSPLPGEQAVFVTAEENFRGRPRFNIEAKPFSPESAPADGWFDFQLMVSKAFILQLGAGGSAGTDVRKDNPYDGTVVMTFLMAAPGSGVSLVWTKVDGKQTSRRLGLTLPQDTPFDLRVLWTTTPETIFIAFQIDGIDASQTDSVSIPNPGSSTGIDYFSLQESGTGSSLINASLFIGKISAGTP